MTPTQTNSLLRLQDGTPAQYCGHNVFVLREAQGGRNVVVFQGAHGLLSRAAFLVHWTELQLHCGWTGKHLPGWCQDHSDVLRALGVSVSSPSDS
jgi:hypothetical protein